MERITFAPALLQGRVRIPIGGDSPRWNYGTDSVPGGGGFILRTLMRGLWDWLHLGKSGWKKMTAGFVHSYAQRRRLKP